MSIETVVFLLFISPFVVGIFAGIFGGPSPTPIIVDYRPSQPATVISQENSDREEEFLSHEDSIIEVESELELKLEESPEALEILKEIEHEGDQPVSKPLEYEASEIPEALNKSLDQFFRAINGDNGENDPVLENQYIHEEPQPQSAGTPIASVDLQDELPPAVSSAEEFEAAAPSIDEMLNQISSASEESGAKIYNFPFGENLPLPPREYWALQQKYGAEVVSKVTTTPGAGGTGDYDCMIGRVIQKSNMALLQYGDHYIPLKGMDNLEGVFLVEGMFIKPDLFFVNNHTDLAEGTKSIGQAAEK
ncbi:hypothetical protein [Paenibacillus taichungensis]